MLNLIAGGLFLFLQIFNLSCDKAPPIVDPDELSAHAKVVVTLVEQNIHIPGCDFIEGPTEKMNYAVAIGKNYILCEHCLVETIDDSDLNIKEKNRARVRSLLNG